MLRTISKLVMIAASLWLTGCGGSDSAGTAVTANYSATLVFPSVGANLGGTTTTTIRGKVTTTGTFDITDISSIDVNGVTAMHDLVDESIWTADIPLVYGPNTITITATYNDNSTDQVSFDISNDLDIVDPRGMAYDNANNRLLYLDAAQRSLNALDLATGVRSVISDDTRGSGNKLTSNLFDILLDSANDRVIMVDSALGLGTVYAIDLTSGDRTKVAGGNPALGSGDNLGITEGVTFGATNDEIYALDNTNKVVVHVDLTNGDRTPVSGGAGPIGTGDDFQDLSAVAYDGANNRLLVVDEGGGGRGWGAVYSVDLAAGTLGDRTRISDSDETEGFGAGARLFDMKAGVLDAANNRLLVVDADLNGASLAAIDLTPGMTLGDRTILSGGVSTTVGNGDTFYRPFALAHDGANDRVFVPGLSDGRAGELAKVIEVDIAAGATLGDRTVIGANASTTGSGEAMGGIRSVELDKANNRAILLRSGSGTGGSLVAVDLANGDRTVLSDKTDNGPGQYFPEGNFVYDAANDRTLSTNSFSKFDPVTQPDFTPGILETDLATGDNSLISTNATLTGADEYNDPVDIAYDAANNRAFVSHRDIEHGIFEIDLATGDGVIIASKSVGTGPTASDLGRISGMVFDSTTGIDGRLLVIDRFRRGIVAVDIETGNRTHISTNSTPNMPVGSGPNPFEVAGLDADVPNDRALMVDFNLDAVFDVVLSTGARTIASDAVTGTGPNMPYAFGVALDHEDDLAYVVDLTMGALVKVDLTNGNRAILSR